MNRSQLQRTPLFIGLLVYGWYMLAILPITVQHAYSATLFLIQLLLAAVPSSLVFFPRSPAFHKAFGSWVPWVVGGFLAIAAIVMLVFTTTCIQICQSTEHLGDANNMAIYVISGIAILLSGLALSNLNKNADNTSTAAIWIWTIRLFVVQLIFTIVLWLAFAGPIA